MKKEIFDELYGMNITPYIEKDYKGLNYISWANAYKLAMDKDPMMTYEIVQDTDGMPYFSRGNVHIVKTKVCMFGETKEMFLPIMDNKHNSVDNPNSRQVNDNIMRCLVKNIAMFGIGLPLYNKEDLIQFKDIEAKEKLIKEITKDITQDDDELLEKMLDFYKRNNLGECTVEELKKIKAKLESERVKRGKK